MCAAVRCERRHYVQANAANRTTTVPVAGRKSLHHKTLWFVRSPREEAYVRAAAAIRGATLQPVGWTRNAERAPIQDVGVDHRRADVRMTEQFLHRSNVVPILEQMGREGVTVMPRAA